MDNKNNFTSVFNANCHVSTENENECNAKVVSSDTVPAAENFPVAGGDFKIPKVLAEFIIQIDAEAKIRLNEPTFEIKRIEKQVFLTQCRFISGTDKVFIEGFIRKNIEYAVRTCTKNHAISGTIKDTTVHVPFRVHTKVDFDGNKPKIRPNLPPMVARFFDEDRMGKNIREADRSNVEIFNEPVFCELEWSAVFDADIDNKGVPIEGFVNEEEFQEFTDKSVVYLCIKLLQKQQVCMPPMMQHNKEELKKCPPPMNSEWNMPITEITKGDY